VSLAQHQAPRRDFPLLCHQIRYEQLSFWRNRQSAFFTFLFPVVIITIFGALFRGASGSSYFYGLSALQYYMPTIAAISVLGACYSQLAIVLSTRRQDGILKRVRATPLPTHWAAIALALVLGAASFRALGVAVASLIRNAEAAPAVVQLILFPLTGPFARHSGFDWKTWGCCWPAAPQEPSSPSAASAGIQDPNNRHSIRR
jgi:ABC-2 type transport system permease protein